MIGQQTKKNSEVKAVANTGNNANGAAAVYVVDPVLEGQGEVQIAYETIVQAQEAFISAFKEQEQQVENAYKNSERRYRAYKEIIDKAFKNREILDNEALELYRMTVEKAAAVYRETIEHALKLCKETTDQAWQASILAYRPVEPPFSTKLRLVVRSITDLLTRAVKNIRTKLIGTYRRIESRIRAWIKTSLEKT